MRCRVSEGVGLEVGVRVGGVSRALRVRSQTVGQGCLSLEQTRSLSSETRAGDRTGTASRQGRRRQEDAFPTGQWDEMTGSGLGVGVQGPVLTPLYKDTAGLGALGASHQLRDRDLWDLGP